MVDLKQIREVELEILMQCIKVCEKHGITYYLGFGSALGAVRHQGFIPWDDDIDILMQDEDIENFKKYFVQEAPSNYFVEDVFTEDVCTFSWLKIRRSDTTSMPIRYKAIPQNWGICIDIFPLYSIKKSDYRLCASLFRVANCFLYAPCARYDKKSKFVKNVVSYIPLSTRRKIALFFINKLRNRKSGDYYFDGWDIFPKDWISLAEKSLDFEGHMLRVPWDTDSYLTRIYGDYMVLPPESERMGHAFENGEIIWSITKSYTEFL